MGYIYNKRTGYFTREDIVEAEKKDAIKSITIVFLAMILLVSIVVNAVLVYENKQLKKELDVFMPNYITGVEQ